MIVERTDKEVIIRLPASIDIEDMQELVDYARYKEITSKIDVSQDEVDEFARGIKKGLWTKNRNKFIK
jgi:hypothetical protein